MPEAEGRAYPWLEESAIETAVLEVIPWHAERDQLVVYQTKEFSAVCPFSGLPDVGRLSVHYIPDTKLVELKSLKYYLTSYRLVGVYQERVTELVSKHLWEFLAPKWLQVRTIYNTRGGIDTTCVVVRGKVPKKEN